MFFLNTTGSYFYIALKFALLCEDNIACNCIKYV